MCLSTLERDAPAGRLELHVVLDDADTKRHRLGAAADRKKQMAHRPIP